MSTANSFIDTYNIEEVHADVTTKPQVQAKEFFVYESGDLPVQEKMFYPSRSTHFSIHLNLGEPIGFKYNLIDYVIEKNSLYIIHPGIVHMLTKVTRLPTITLGFTHEFIAASMVHQKHAEALGFLSAHSNPLYLLKEKDIAMLYPIMVLLKNMGNNKDHPFRTDMVHHGFNLFMLEVAAIATEQRGGKEKGMSRQEDLLLRFMKELSTHFKEERSVQYYAGTLFVTSKHLTKTVKELTNKTCGELIDEMVITEAKILLGNLSSTVGQVADELNFSDQFFFSKFFKRHSGFSPKEYKSLI